MGEVYQEKTHESDGDLKPDPCMMILEVGDMIDNHWTDGNWCLPLVQAVLLQYVSLIPKNTVKARGLDVAIVIVLVATEFW